MLEEHRLALRRLDLLLEELGALVRAAERVEQVIEFTRLKFKMFHHCLTLLCLQQVDSLCWIIHNRRLLRNRWKFLNVTKHRVLGTSFPENPRMVKRIAYFASF